MRTLENLCWRQLYLTKRIVDIEELDKMMQDATILYKQIKAPYLETFMRSGNIY